MMHDVWNSLAAWYLMNEMEILRSALGFGVFFFVMDCFWKGGIESRLERIEKELRKIPGHETFSRW